MNRKMVDEMELSLAYRATKYSHAFTVLALIGYCMYRIIALKQFPTIPLLIVFTQGLLSFLLRQIFMHKLTSANNHEE